MADIIKNIFHMDRSVEFARYYSTFAPLAEIKISISCRIIFMFSFVSINDINVYVEDYDLTVEVLERNGFRMYAPSRPRGKIDSYPPAILVNNYDNMDPETIGTKCAKCGKIFRKLSAAVVAIHNSYCYGCRDWPTVPAASGPC